MTAEKGLLERYGASGLLAITAYFDWVEDSQAQLGIHFAAPRRQKAANYLAGNIEKVACRNCQLGDGLQCSGIEVDGDKQIGATLTSETPLTKKQWQDKIPSFLCTPRMHKAE